MSVIVVFLRPLGLRLLKAKTSEAKSNLGAIRSTEVAYYAEWDYYVGNQTITPTDRSQPGTRDDKQPWDFNSRFSILGFAPEGDVYYSYLLDGIDYDPSMFTSRIVAMSFCEPRS